MLLNGGGAGRLHLFKTANTTVLGICFVFWDHLFCDYLMFLTVFLHCLRSLLQNGQPVPRVLSFTTAFHSCPRLHLHQTFLLLPGVTWSGVKSPFLVGCHSSISSGFLTARSWSEESVNSDKSLCFSIKDQPIKLCVSATTTFSQSFARELLLFRWNEQIKTI